MKRNVIFYSLLVLTGCVSVPVGFESQKFILHSLLQVHQSSGDCQCKTVRLGGRVLNAKALKEKTRLEILSFPIENYSAKPRLEAVSDGRFIAYIPYFIDPETMKDQYITVAGVLHQNEQGYIDEVSYAYPVVKVTNYQKWKKIEEYYSDVDDWENRRGLWREGIFYSFDRPITRVRYVLSP